MIQIGVTIQGAGAGVIVSEHRPAGDVVIEIASLPFDVDVVAGRVRDLATREDAQVVIDGDGLGDALWDILYPEARIARALTVTRPRLRDGSPAAWRYDDRGIARQRLVNVLVVAMNQRAIHFAAALPGMDAMTKALVTYRREVKEDGLVGPELVTALCLAILPRVGPTQHHAFLA